MRSQLTTRPGVVPARRTSVRPSRPVVPGVGHVLAVPPCSLVVLGGLPGAGKTTLLRRVAEADVPGVRSLDAEEVAARLRGRAGAVPYRLLRPAVHALHLLRVLRAVRGDDACVLTTDPLTSPARRLLLRAAAAGSGRSLSVVLVDATPEQARQGQRRRGRALGRRRMARHVARTARLHAALDRSGGASCFDDVLVLPRATAGRTDGLVLRPGRLALQLRRSCAA